MTVPGAATYFLPSINDKTRLEKLCLYANLTTAQSQHLLTLPKISTLEIQSGSWNVADILPKWIQTSLHQSLRHLTLYMVIDLNGDVLEAALAHPPDLRSLHVIGCPKADHNVVLRAVRHTPRLQNLSLSTSVGFGCCQVWYNSEDMALGGEQDQPLPPSELSCIRSLSLDCRSPDAQDILSALFQYLRTTYFPLTSFKLRVVQKNVAVPLDFIKDLVEVHGHSLQRLSFLDCEVQIQSIEHICNKCPKLERLDLALPMKELGTFAKAISEAKNLRTIVDIDNHVQHGTRTFLTPDNVELFMDCAPSLRIIIDGNRVWTRQRLRVLSPVSLERRPIRKAGL